MILLYLYLFKIQLHNGLNMGRLPAQSSSESKGYIFYKALKE